MAASRAFRRSKEMARGVRKVKLAGFARRKRRLSAVLGICLVAGFAGFRYAITVNEGTKRHLGKQLSEASRMPGRLLT